MGIPLWELIVNLAETILFYFYISSMLSPTRKKIIIKSCYLFFLFSSISVLNYFEISSILTVLLALAGHVFFSILFFEVRALAYHDASDFLAPDGIRRNAVLERERRADSGGFARCAAAGLYA